MEARSVRKSNQVDAERLQSLIVRIEQLDEERQIISGDIRDIYAEAKSVGYDVKTMRKIVALRKIEAADRAEQAALLDVYAHALQMELF